MEAFEAYPAVTAPVAHQIVLKATAGVLMIFNLNFIAS